MAAELSNLEIMDRYGSLGPDFLTWLVVESMRDTLDPPESEPGLTVIPKGPLVLVSESGEATKVSLTGDEAVSSAEFISAIRQGKRLLRAKLEFTAQDATWDFTLDSQTFDVKSAKLPVPKVSDLDEFMSLRIQATQHLYHILGEMYDSFLHLRCDEERWPEVLQDWSKMKKI